MTFASPRSSSVSWLASAVSLDRSNPRASRSGFSSSKSHRVRLALAAVAEWYALTTCEEVTIAFAPGCPGTEIPYSVSMPITRRTLMAHSVVPGGKRTGGRARDRPPVSHREVGPRRATSQVLASVCHGVDRPAGLVAALPGDQGPDVDDPLALLARDPGPVVRVGRVGQVLVLAELVHARREQVRDPQALSAGLEELLDRHFLRPVHDVLDHGARVEVLEVEHFLVAVGVGDLEEPVLLRLAVHPLDDPLDHLLHRRLGGAAVLGDVVRVQRQAGDHVLGEDVPGSLGVRPFDLYLHVQAARAQDGRVDHVLAVGGADDNDVFQALYAVDLAEQLRHDRVLDVAGYAGAPGTEDRVHLVEEHDHRHALAGLLPGPLEHQPDVPLSLPHVLVKQLRALDVEEEALAFLGRLAGILAVRLLRLLRQLGGPPGDLLGEGVRDGLGDQ